MSASTDLRHIPLDALHRELGAKMGGFAGFDMPIQYPAGLKQEHQQTRERAGLFDVSHMGQIKVTARDGSMATLARELEAALPLDVDTWPVGHQKYSYLLNDAGGIEDDLMLVRMTDHVRIVANAGNRDRDFALLARLCPGLVFEWIDAALIALQGPAAERVLAALDPRAAALTFMQAAPLQLAGTTCLATRSGYTGEDGYEISVPTAAAEPLARRLLADPHVGPVGLGARDTLRLEAGLPLHGNDIGPTTTPVAAGLAFAIPKTRRIGGTKAGGFPGASVVLREFAEPPPRKLAGLVSYDPVPIRPHVTLLDGAGRTVGEVTSGTVSPTLNRPVMLAYVDRLTLESIGTTPLAAVVRDKRPAVHVTPLPFVPKRYKR